MCGIIGLASSAINNSDWLLKARDQMIHRGPDDAGFWSSEDKCVVLGHRRLAIVDLSTAGHQPMSRDSLTIVFNGEIYNYKDLQTELKAKGHNFHSQSDTEVVLAAYQEWGTDCLSHLNGIFALALYDTKQQIIFMARDRAGEKPLFYTVNKAQLSFASELKALMADPTMQRRINSESLDTFLTMGYVPGGACILEGVNKLPPAHALVFNLSDANLRVWRYWELPEAPSNSAHYDEHTLLLELEELLEDAVRRQLVADVPVGVLLSGGVDSSLITAMAARVSSQVKTFTVGFTGFEQYDERPHARLIADHFHTEHLELNAASITPDLLQKLAHQYDEPMIDSSMIPTYLVSQLVRQHCTVALGGDGGDELFGGYKHYNRLLWSQEKFRFLPFILRKIIASSAGALLPLGFKGRNWLQSLACDLNTGLPLMSSFFDPTARLGLMGQNWQTSAERIWADRIPQTADLVQRMTRMDFENYMPEDILVKVDRASMLNSLELRAPLLDYRMIEFAFGRVPSYLKTTISQRKILLKKLAAKILPPEFDQQRKQGFSIPLADWLKAGPWRDYFSEVLLDPSSLFNRQFVTQLFQAQDQGRNNQERLFGLVLFELWRREYKLS